MNKKYYLFLMLLLCGVGAVFQVNAKPPKQNPANNQSQTNNVDSTKIEDEEVSRPKINQIRFSGNTTISSETLIKAIPLKVKDIANENTIMNSMIKIAQIYKAKNIKVTITPIIEKVSTELTNIQFDIHETSIQEK